MKGSVSKGLTYLISQDPNSTSGKAQTARQYGVKVIGIDEAQKLAGV
jgi:NAD-dependent DNA ligase